LFLRGSPEFLAALGVSDEDFQVILLRRYEGTPSENPEYRKAMQEYEEAFRVMTGGQPPFMGAVIPPVHWLNEEQLRARNRLQELGRRMESMMQAFAAQPPRPRVSLEELITPERWQKIREAELVTMVMGKTRAITPSLFEALNLTDAQREGMERIKKELEPEFEKYLDAYADNMIAGSDMRRAALALHRRQAPFDFSFDGFPFDGDINARDAWEKARWQAQVEALAKSREEALAANAVVWKEMQENPEYQRLLDEMTASSKAFAMLFRTRMSEILTDEQRSRLQELIDNPPPHVLQVLIQR